MPIYSLFGTNGQLFVYEDRLEIKRMGVVAKYTHLGSAQTTIPYNKIKSFEMHLGTMLYSGYFYFQRDGTKNHISLFESGTNKNAVAFRFYRNDIAKKIKQYLQTVIQSKVGF